MLTRDEILSAKDGDVKIVSVPEWGGEIGIRRLRACDAVRARILSEDEDQSDSSIRMAGFLVLVLCDAEGNLLFTADDVPQLQVRSADVLRRLCEEANNHLFFGGQNREELEKNSDSGPS